MNKETHRSFPILLASIIIFLALGAGAFLIFKDTNPPIIHIQPQTRNVGKDTQITVAISDIESGLKSVAIIAIQKNKQIKLIQKEYAGGSVKTQEVIDLAKGQLNEGPFTLQATAQDASLYPFGEAGLATAKQDFVYDATPPRIYVQTHTNNINQGGSGLIVYTLSEEAAETGIRSGDIFFPAYLQPSTEKQKIYYCMFAVPWNTAPDDFNPMIEAVDQAGNKTVRSFNYHVNMRHFRHDKIRLSDSFLKRTIPEFQALIPQTGSLIDQYVFINNTIRKENRAKLKDFSRDTSPTILWSGTFKRLSNAANRAGYADSRDYMYNGKKVDFQTHLGLDLASTRNAKVPAGNNGRIVYADFLGIYGNVVVIDHGLGLQTLYAHLSEIHVHTGDTVAKGDVIGRTGTTGLAGGDHLHYGVIVAGIPVQPIEWWDKSWIRNNITSKVQ